MSTRVETTSKKSGGAARPMLPTAPPALAAAGPGTAMPPTGKDGGMAIAAKQVPAHDLTHLRIFARPGAEEHIVSQAHQAVDRVGFDFPATLRGSTAHFNVYYDDTTLGSTGATIADGVLATCETDYNTISSYFGGLTPNNMPFNVIIAALDPSGGGGGGAYHYGCGAVDLYCDAKTNPGVDIDYTRFLVVAEEVEVFSDTQGLGWDCGASNGEGLSRVLATDLYPAELDGYTTAAVWLDTPGRPDYVTVNDPTDRSAVSTGCSVLFLNYLQVQLDFTWTEIVAAGASTLNQTYQILTGQTDGLTPFKDLLQAFYPEGTPSGLTNDDPFPLLPALSFPLCGVQFRGTVPAGSTETWFTYNWPVHWQVIWNVVPTTVAGGPELSWNLQTQKSSGDYMTYWISITNLTGTDVDVEARYCVPCYV
jgi:hypothetical protein